MISRNQEDTIKEVLSPFQPTEIGIFGSYSRGDQKDHSDLDILVSFAKRINLFELIELERELSLRLNLKVDLVTRKSLSELIENEVKQDLVMIAS